MFDLSVYLANVGAEREDWPREKLLVSSSFRIRQHTEETAVAHLARVQAYFSHRNTSRMTHLHLLGMDPKGTDKG